MTFRPSDDVLEQVNSEGNTSFLWENTENQNEWQNIFNSQENQWDNIEWNWNSVIIDSPIEEVVAPDLSELLKDTWNVDDNQNNQSDWLKKIEDNKEVNDSMKESNTLDWDDNSQEMQNSAITPEKSSSNQDINQTPDNQIQNVEVDNTQKDYEDSSKILDEDRKNLVSSIEWSINSNLDYLVDNDWFRVIEKYKIVNRLFFRWWAFFLTALIGIIWWIFLQVKANHLGKIERIDDSKINNKWKWVEETSDKKMSVIADNWVDVETIIPYGFVSIDWGSFNSKSNLIKYKGIVLPQLISINYVSWNLASIQTFDIHNLRRTDIKNLIETLILDNTNYRQTTNFANIWDVRWIGNTFQWSLEEWFNLWCLDNSKLSDLVCDKFLNTFYQYGKYYDLSKYSSDLSKLVKKIKRQWKDIKPICNMVKDYTLRAWAVSKELISIMENCGTEDYQYYKKLVNFIDLENSLWKPELSDKVFDDPDLNAYKLLSAQQGVYKILDGTSLNENYIISYLNYVQALINKDNGNNRYIEPIYKDLLYVFNMDELYQKLMQKWKLSSDIKLKINQINNWNTLNINSVSLMSQLTIPDIVQKDSDLTDLSVEERTLEDLFSQYYAMTDRLKIRKAAFISDEEIKVQTELFTDKIMKVTNGETLKVTVLLHRRDNLLYVDSIKIANQPKFTEILGIYVAEWDITFYAMLNYIDEQVWMWYESAPAKIEKQQTFCEELSSREDISIYECGEESISLYKWETEYNFELKNWILDSFTIDDENLESAIKEKLNWVMFMKEDTPTIISAIIDFSIESNEDNIEKKLEIIDQFRIHFKLVPDNIYDIDWEPDKFLINFTLWDFKMQGNYDFNTHLLTKISYADCEKPLEIRKLSLEITLENEAQLIEILNNPKVYFASINPSIYKVYQKECSR